MEWYKKSQDDVFQHLGAGPEGLTHGNAEERLRQYGPNKLAEEDAINLWKIALDQLKSPLIYILFIAGIVTLALGEYIDSGVIFAVILLNGVIGFTQELKAETNVRSLKSMVNPKARVLREGKEKEMDSSLLVPGDVVLLISGTMVPADLRLFQTTDCKIDESVLTGESIPVEKMADWSSGENLTPGDQVNMAFMGTTMVTGRARGVVVETGMNTILGAISKGLRSIGTVRAPIQDKIERFARFIGLLVLGAASVIFVLGIIMGESIENMFMTAVATAVAAVPEGLPVVVTIALAVGVSRMAKHKAIVRKLPAVETLGSTTVICSDKTGTLTLNKMTVKKLYDGQKIFTVSGEGYLPSGDILDDNDIAIQPSGNVLETFRIGLLCNESRLEQEEGEYRVDGDPTEGALLVAAQKAGLALEQEQAAYPQIDILPFESDRGYMATLHVYEGRKLLYVKGGPDRLLEICSKCEGQPGLDRQDILDKAKSFAAEGLRVLAFACKELPSDIEGITDADVTTNLVFVGLQGMLDPPRPESIEAVENCKRAGIRVVMITGDHADTALSIARQLGLETRGLEVITGIQLKGMSDEELARELKEVSVFARIAPEDKYRIVHQLKEQGEIVAVTGDGVNDAPALKGAHIGVAMGKGGTDAAREASDMVLADDNFKSIFEAVREGRIVFDNLRKVVFFLIPTGVASIVSILASLLLGLPIPYLPAQLLWINLVTNGLQDVALAFEPAETGIIHRPPRSPREGIINRLLMERIVIIGLVIGGGVIFVFKRGLIDGMPLDKARTLAMTTMVLFQFFQALNSRSETKSIFRMNPFSNRFLFLSMILALAAQILVIYAPPLQWVFRTTPLGGMDWLLAAATALSVILVVEVDKWLRQRK